MRKLPWQSFRLAGGGLCLTALAVLASGCGSATGHVSGEVKGKDGKVIPDGKVMFYPMETQANPVVAMIKDGKYEADVPVGQAKVSVQTGYLDPNQSNDPRDQQARVEKNMKAGKLPKNAGLLMPKDIFKDKDIPKIDRPHYDGVFTQIDPRNENPGTSGLTCNIERAGITFDIKLKY
jgi:hypothetical protein